MWLAMFKDDKQNLKKYPSKYECMEILQAYGTPQHVQDHCNAVGEVASAIARELNKKGLKVDENLVSSAGYLHDIARIHKVHEQVGAEYLKSIGLEDIADVMKDHTKHRINENISMLDEEDILCIADRVVIQSNYVGPEKRMEYIMSKAILKYGPESQEKLDKIKNDFIEFVKRLEGFIGEEIGDIIPEEVR